MALEMRIPLNTATEWSIPMTTADGDYAQFDSGDVFRWKLKLAGVTVLEVTSAGATANGSTITVVSRGNGSSVHASFTLRLDQSDLPGSTMAEGQYLVEVGYTAASDSDYHLVAQGQATLYKAG